MQSQKLPKYSAVGPSRQHCATLVRNQSFYKFLWENQDVEGGGDQGGGASSSHMTFSKWAHSFADHHCMLGFVSEKHRCLLVGDGVGQDAGAHSFWGHTKQALQTKGHLQLKKDFGLTRLEHVSPRDLGRRRQRLWGCDNRPRLL